MKQLTLLLLMCLGAFTFAQDELPEFNGEVNWSEFFEVSKRAGSPDIIGQDGDYVYLTRTIKRDKFIEKYDIRTLRLVKSVELELKYEGKSLNLGGQDMYENSPILFTNFYNTKTKTTYSFVQKVNKSTLTLSKPIVINQTKTPKAKGIRANIGMSMTSSAGGLASELLISENGALGFVTETVYADQEKKNDPLTYLSKTGRLYDENFDVVAENEYELPYDRFTIIQRRLGNDGLVYFAGYETETEIDKSRILNRENTVYGDLEILVLDVESGDIEVLTVATENREIKNFTIQLQEDGGLVVAGLMGKEEGGVSGGFYARYNALLQEQSMNFVDFDEDFITQGWSERSKKKLEKKQDKEKNKGKKKTVPTFYNYKIRDLITKPDGTTTLLAEQYYVRVVTRTYTTANGGTRTTTTYYYYYNDIIALNFDTNGDLVWKTVIDKYQVSTNDGGFYSSFFTVLEGNDINIIYNDRESTTVDTDGMTRREKKDLRGYVGIRVLLDEVGEQSKEKLFEFEEGGLRLVPKVCESSGEDFAFMYARSRRGDKIGTIQW